jgi:hypothetical protein
LSRKGSYKVSDNIEDYEDISDESGSLAIAVHGIISHTKQAKYFHEVKKKNIEIVENRQKNPNSVFRKS